MIADRDAGGRLIRRAPDRDDAAALAVGDGVLHQVVEHAGQFLRVGRNGQGVGHIQLHGVAVRLKLRMELLDHLHHEQAHIHRADLQRHVRQIEPGDVEELVDQRVQALGLVQRGMRVSASLLLRHVPRLVQQTQIADYRGHRRADVMREIHDQIVFALFGHPRLERAAVQSPTRLAERDRHIVQLVGQFRHAPVIRQQLGNPIGQRREDPHHIRPDDEQVAEDEHQHEHQHSHRRCQIAHALDDIYRGFPIHVPHIGQPGGDRIGVPHQPQQQHGRQPQPQSAQHAQGQDEGEPAAGTPPSAAARLGCMGNWRTLAGRGFSSRRRAGSQRPRRCG